jgi:hypothetical protein
LQLLIAKQQHTESKSFRPTKSNWVPHKDPQEDVMKSKLIAAFALVLAATAVSVPATLAQAPQKVDIPFAFHAGKAALPAGIYEVHTSPNGIVTLRNRQDWQTVMVLGQTDYRMKPHQAGVVFHEYRDKYFLAQIWDAGATGLTVPATRQEREYQASNEGATAEQDVLLAMK